MHHCIPTNLKIYSLGNKPDCKIYLSTSSVIVSVVSVLNLISPQNSTFSYILALKKDTALLLQWAFSKYVHKSYVTTDMTKLNQIITCSIMEMTMLARYGYKQQVQH